MVSYIECHLINQQISQTAYHMQDYYHYTDTYTLTIQKRDKKKHNIRI